MGESVPICPFCGAPYEKFTPRLGSTCVVCEQCGCLFFISSKFGGFDEWCTNHPDRVAVSLCDKCWRPFCRSCLQVVEEAGRGVVLCSDCLLKFKAEKARAKLAARRRIIKAIAVIAIIIGSLITYSMFTYTEPIGSAVRNWPPARNMEGVSIIVTPEDPRKMNIENLTEYVSERGKPGDFVSVVITFYEVAHVKFKGATLQPFTKRITIKATWYSCGRPPINPFFSGGVSATPHKEVLTVFLGRLQPGRYIIKVEKFYGGDISWVIHEGKTYPVYEHPYREEKSGTSTLYLWIG